MKIKGGILAAIAATMFSPAVWACPNGFYREPIFSACLPRQVGLKEASFPLTIPRLLGVWSLTWTDSNGASYAARADFRNEPSGLTVYLDVMSPIQAREQRNVRIQGNIIYLSNPIILENPEMGLYSVGDIAMEFDSYIGGASFFGDARSADDSWWARAYMVR